MARRAGPCRAMIGRQSAAQGDHPMAESGRTRIWWQSFVDPVAQAPYINRLGARLAKLAGPDVSVDVHGITPPDRHFHALTEFRCADEAIRAALRAEKEGYDAFVLGHFQEPGIT